MSPTAFIYLTTHILTTTMSILNEAHDFVVESFIGIQNNYQYGQTGIDVLREASYLGAAVDSREQAHRRCFPGTREQYIVDITSWAMSDVDKTLSMYWMRGPAGVGKSSIARTCAEKLKSYGQLGAAFFFSIGKHDGATRLIPTLAYQLSTAFSDYRAIINAKVYNDKTLVEKTLASQFNSLIIEPFQELKKQGRCVRRTSIIIDGLDECADRESQVEIIRIIASSIRVGSTPFRWAVFSREEPYIVSTFTSPSVSSHCYSVYLPISRKADEEIELYLRGGFANILQRRNLLYMSFSWPTPEHIKTLVDAAAGLFAHPATVLRYVDHHSYSGFKEALDVVLISISKPGTQPGSPYTELDALYTLILQRIPEDTLLPVQLFLSYLVLDKFNGRSWRIGVLCNSLGISETIFQSIYHHLGAVITFQPSQPALDEVTLDLVHPCYGPDTFKPDPSLENQLFGVLGTVNFHHKSFYDFLINPARSHGFCVSTLAAREKLLSRFVQQQLHYSSSYTIHSLRLILASGVANSSSSLSWPRGSEFVDSFLKFHTFRNVSLYLSHDHPRFRHFLEGVPLNSLKKLADLDYRKSLVAGLLQWRYLSWSNPLVVGHVGTAQVLPHTAFGCLDEKKFVTFEPAVFLAMVEKLEEAGVIRAYHPQLGSSHLASFFQVFSRYRWKYSGKCWGQYKLGHAERSVI